MCKYKVLQFDTIKITEIKINKNKYIKIINETHQKPTRSHISADTTQQIR